MHRLAARLVVFLLYVLIGCQAPAPRAAPLSERIGMVLPDLAHPPQSDILLTSAVAPSSAAASPACPFSDAAELSEELLIEQVLARNPSLAQMTAVWRAAAARYPQ